MKVGKGGSEVRRKGGVGEGEMTFTDKGVSMWQSGKELTHGG